MIELSTVITFICTNFVGMSNSLTTDALTTSLSAPLSIIAKIVSCLPVVLFTIVTGTIGRTTSSLAETDLDAAVAASHASTLGDRVSTPFGVAEGAAGAAGFLSKGASGIPLPALSPPFLASFSSLLFGYVRPWRIVACCFRHVAQVGRFAHPFAECPGSKQWKHNRHEASFCTRASTSTLRSR